MGKRSRNGQSGIRPSRRHGCVNTMAEESRKSIYISDAQSRIEEYRQHLTEKGLKPASVNNHIVAVRVSLNEISEACGDITLESFDGETRRIIRDNHSGSSDLCIRRRILSLAGFVRWCTGTCPTAFMDAVSNSQLRSDTADVRARYAREIAHFTEALDAEGRARETIDNIVCDAAICLTALIGEFGPRPLSAIGVRDMMWLDENLGRARDRRHNCMACLGRLVSSACGNDPYRAFRTHCSMDAIEERLHGMPFGDEILAMAGWMKDHNFRSTTIQTRVRCLESFIPRVIDIIGEFRLEDVTLDTFYLIRSRMSDVSESTLATYMAALDALIQFSTGHKVYDGRKMLWNNNTVKRTFITQEEWKAILATAGRTERMAIMLASMLGMRLFEIVNLRLDDMTDDAVTIRGKGHGTNGKVSVKDIPPMLKKEIAQYMEYRAMLISRYGDASEGHFIINDRQNICGPLTRDGLSSRFTALSRKTGIPFSAHTFRRFYACTLHRAGVAPEVIMRMMRHECIDTTLRCYIQAEPSLMKSAEDALERQLFG